MEQNEYLQQLPRAEKLAYLYAQRLEGHIDNAKGRYLLGDDGTVHVNLGGRCISLDFDRNNRGLAAMMMKACGVSTLDKPAQAAIQWIQVSAEKEGSAIRLRRFSALSGDGLRLYIPIRADDGKILRITPEGIAEVPNGDNESSVWVEHPYGNPFSYADADPTGGDA